MFHANDKLYQYTRVIMGVKPAQEELNAALNPIFAHILNVYVIHDDLIIAAKTFNKHNLALEEVIKALDPANLTLKITLHLTLKMFFWKNRNHILGNDFLIKRRRKNRPRKS